MICLEIGDAFGIGGGGGGTFDCIGGDGSGGGMDCSGGGGGGGGGIFCCNCNDAAGEVGLFSALLFSILVDFPTNSSFLVMFTVLVGTTNEDAAENEVNGDACE